MSYPPQPPDGPEDPSAAPPPPSPYGSAPPPPYGSAPPPPPPSYGSTPPPGYPNAPAGAPGVPAGNQKALWSMILGIVGLFCCFVISIVAIVLGLQAKQEIAASGGWQTGAGQAQAGFVLGIIGCALGVIGVLFYAVLGLRGW